MVLSWKNLLWKMLKSIYDSQSSLFQSHVFFENSEVYLLRLNQQYFCLFVMQILGWVEFVQLKTSQKDCHLFISYLMRCPISLNFWYLFIALVITTVIFSKNQSILVAFGGRYILKHIHFFLEIVNSCWVLSLLYVV